MDLKTMFNNLFHRSENSGQAIAEQRLRLVLSHDRANISPGIMEVIKDEIIGVLSKHLDIDAEHVQVNFTEDRRNTRLVADVPLQPTQRRRRG
ncbi:MAG: cell division topological specificity factor MinE [Anaerolineales bacterium]